MADTPISGLDATTPIPLTKKSTAVDPNLLQNMQAMVDERSGPNPKDMIFSGPNYNSFMSGLKDAAAWASGGVNGPSAALAARDREKSLEAKDLYEMRTKIATMQAAQERQKRAAEFLGIGGASAQPGAEAQIGTQPVGTPGQPGAAAQPGAGQLPPRAEQMLAGLPSATQNLARLALLEGDTEGFKSIVAEGIKTRPDMQKNFEYAQTLPADQREVYLRTVQKEGYAPQSYIGADGKEYKFTPTAAMPKEAGAAPTAPAPGAATTAPAAKTQYTDFDVNKTYGTPTKLLDNLRSVESGNDPHIINKTTKALGAYQFMPETASMLHRQGMKFNAFDEKESRAAADYYISQLAKQNGGDYNKAMAQYGGFITKDPTEYVGKVLKGVDTKQPAATTPSTALTETQPAATVAPRDRLSQEDIKAQTAGETRRREKMAEGDVDTTKAIVDIGRNAGEKSIRLADAARIVNDPTMKDMFGVLERGGVLGPITKFVAGGVQMGTLGSLKFGEMEGALRNAGATETQIANVHRIETVLKQQELEYAKTYLKGQGAVSDNERNIVKQAIGSISQPAEQLRLMVNIMQERAAFDNKMYQEFNAYRKAVKDPYASFEKFTIDSPAADRLIAEHNQALARTLKVDSGALNDPFNKDIATRADKQTGGGVTYRKVGQ
ncbi:LT_GEWL domain containing protein [uncultured Caudovirales phage]|uniref:LT_GEWL domain containing protein n=1 Tax=uncultured Caudovirales phage TaxID=2100421 RepID=A0A6J7XNA8_9CAUD|nr:LT_GEWL domain containing protein [uncultured Caudovirales phage]